MNLCVINHRLQRMRTIPIYLYSYTHLLLFLCCSILYMPQCLGEDVVYVSASFKTWLLSDNFLWNYSPNRLRENHPEIQSHYLKNSKAERNATLRPHMRISMSSLSIYPWMRLRLCVMITPAKYI